MSALPLTYIPNLILRNRTSRVTTVSPAINKLIDDMIETMHVENGVGIAANQVDSNLRIAYIEIPEGIDEDDVVIPSLSYVMINPTIIKRIGIRIVDEGCLSVPGFRGSLQRSVKVTVKALDREGKEYRIKGENLLAQALEHEIDHLNGVVYIDRMESVADLENILETEETDKSFMKGDPNNVWRLRKIAPKVERRV